jgi:site-specific DNA-methyltransferase (adenine-specific)
MLVPYYSDERVTLYHGRMEEVMPQLPRADCVVTDCTYGETALEWDKWVDGWPSIAAERLKKPGTMWCFGSFRMFTEHWAEFVEPFELVQDRIWEKQNGSAFMTDRFRRVHEMMVQFRHKGAAWGQVYHDDESLKEPGGVRKRIYRQHKPKHFNGYGPALYESDDGGNRQSRSVIYMKNMHGRAINETEKPVGLVRPLVKYSCPPGGLVVDPFAGSGSTLLACRQEGRRAIGIELRESQCELTAKRLAESKELQFV